MEKWTVVGFKKIEFKPKDSDRVMKGYKLYLQRPAYPELGSDQNVTGQITDFLNCWDGSSSEYLPIVGDTISVRYNRYGKISSIETC